jgi:hypothetical protein
LEGFRRLRIVNRHSDKSRKNPALRTNSFPDLSEPVSLLIRERDDGQYQIGFGDAAPGPPLAFARANEKRRPVSDRTAFGT